jgi:hypothetical protein
MKKALLTIPVLTAFVLGAWWGLLAAKPGITPSRCGKEIDPKQAAGNLLEAGASTTYPETRKGRRRSSAATPAPANRRPAIWSVSRESTRRRSSMQRKNSCKNESFRRLGEAASLLSKVYRFLMRIESLSMVPKCQA